MMNAIEGINQIAQDMQAYLTDFRNTSGKNVIAVMHPVVPQEVIYAAGLHPIRLFPSIGEPISLAHTNLHIYTSSIFRAIWDQVLKGHYANVDGVVLPESCETVTFFARGWKWHRPDDFVATLGVRFKKTENAINFFSKEIARLAKTMGDFSGKEVSADSLSGAIRVYNRNRELLRKVYDLRKDESPPISGVEAFKIMMVSFLMDKEENNQLLEQLLDELQNRKEKAKPKARLMVSGPCIVDGRLIETMESSGALVVADDTNTGSRSFWHAVDPNQDPLLALARGYSKVPCPFATSADDRFDYISRMVSEYGVNGVVFAVEKWCESEKMDFPYLEHAIDGKLGVPVTFVETEYLCDMAPIRTRIDGFVESITG